MFPRVGVKCTIGDVSVGNVPQGWVTCSYNELQHVREAMTMECYPSNVPHGRMQIL